MVEATLSSIDPHLALSLFGPRDQHLKAIRDSLGVAITHRNGEIRVAGDEGAVTQATKALEQLKVLAERNGVLVIEDVNRVLSLLANGGVGFVPEAISVNHLTRRISPRSPGQSTYVQSIRANDVVFAVGPAGTGKTYLAVAMAVEALKARAMKKIVLVRPAVEAGESLGYLPGDLQAKINPYLRPLLDALNEMIDHDQIKRLMEQDIIEVIPLAYMRGRTLNEAFIILDEGQNTTISQMKMFLTRMGSKSKIVVAGDVTQVDLPAHTRNGLNDAVARLRGIEGIAVVELHKSDIVRHKLVQEIVRAYEDESQPVHKSQPVHTRKSRPN